MTVRAEKERSESRATDMAGVLAGLHDLMSTRKVMTRKGTVLW